ncbi:MAG: hypothetical protein ACXWP6_21035 [Ktedonobacterales bacterium]
MVRVRALLREPRVRVVAALLMLVGIYVGAVAAPPSVADTLTVTARLQERFCEGDFCWEPPHNKTVPRLVFVRTIRDGATIAAVRDAIYRIPRHAPGFFIFTNGLCNTLATRLYYYDLQFSRFGVLLQDVTVDSWCPVWHISTLGMPSIFDRINDAAIVNIAHVTGMPTIPGS